MIQDNGDEINTRFLDPGGSYDLYNQVDTTVTNAASISVNTSMVTATANISSSTMNGSGINYHVDLKPLSEVNHPPNYTYFTYDLKGYEGSKYLRNICKILIFINTFNIN